jgi:site-specific recombinase XerD
MVIKKVPALILFAVRDARKGFLISLRASNRYSPKYLDGLEQTIGFLATYADENRWPGVEHITTSHIEEYLTWLQTRERWFGDRSKAAKPYSQSSLETQYRRLKRFFNWLVERDHVEKNPLNLIPHPHIDERVVSTVSELEIVKLLKLTDPVHARTHTEAFLITRNRAVLYVLWDTPARKTELGTLTVESVDMDVRAILGFGKGLREHWLPLGKAALDALWTYMQMRVERGTTSNLLWVDKDGNGMNPDWLRHMLKRLGEAAGVPGLHPHRFRHTYAVNALRAGMPERILMINGDWKKIPATYFKTLDAEDVARFHREISPGDRLGQGNGSGRQGQRPRKARRRL